MARESTHFLPRVFFWCSKGSREEEEGREQLRRSPFFRRFSPSNGTGAGPLLCPGRRMWCWRREGNRDHTPPVSAQPTARGRVEEDEEGRGEEEEEGFSRSETALGKLR